MLRGRGRCEGTGPGTREKVPALGGRLWRRGEGSAHSPLRLCALLLPVTAGFCLGGDAVRTGLALVFFYYYFSFIFPNPYRLGGPWGLHLAGRGILVAKQTTLCFVSGESCGPRKGVCSWGEEVALFTCVSCAVTWRSAPQAAVARRRGGTGCLCPLRCPKRTFRLCLRCAPFLSGSSVKGRRRNSPRGSRLLPPLFSLLFRGAVPRCRRLERSGAQLCS